jgi:mono/diheme cytochrome c family protein
MSGRAFSRIAVFVFASTLLLHAQAGQQAPRPADERIGNRLGALTPADPAAIERGRTLYSTGCAFCHGADARGAQGPDLARSLYVTNDVGGRVLGEFLKTGRPANGMPPFPTLTASDLTDLSAFLKTRVTAAMSRPPMDPSSIVVGNAAARPAIHRAATSRGSAPSTTRSCCRGA